MRLHPKLQLHSKLSLPPKLPLRPLDSLRLPFSLHDRLSAPLAFSPGSLAMYAVTFALEVPVILVRVLLAFFACTIILAITGHSTVPAGELANLALIPTLWSVIALATPVGSGWWWRQRIGGRRPSQREQLAYTDAIELLAANSTTPVPEPGVWFVLDTHEPDAAVLGDALMLSRGVLESPHLPAVLAHELGHLATPDGRVTAALNRLVISPPIYKADPDEYAQEPREKPVIVHDDTIAVIAFAISATIWMIRKTLTLARGGLGLRVMCTVWGRYWREREYTADRYAAALGQADELADFLEVHALIHDHPIPFIWLTDHTHPPTELRIDQLRAHADNDTYPDPPPALPHGE
jgi:Zn-dependent protease with chaperone function